VAVLSRCIFLAPGTTNCSAVTGFTTSLASSAGALQGCYAPDKTGGKTGRCPSSVTPTLWNFALYDRTAVATPAAVLTECRNVASVPSLSAGCAAVPGLAGTGYDAEVSAAGVAAQPFVGCVRAAACPTEYAKFLLSANTTLESCQTTLASCPATHAVQVCSGDISTANAAGGCATPDGCLATAAQTCISAPPNGAVSLYPKFALQITSSPPALKACFAAATACAAATYTVPARQGTSGGATPIAGCTDGNVGTCTVVWQAISNPLNGNSNWLCVA
jgi:hypothetical protein